MTDSKARPERLETQRLLEGLVFEVDRDRVLMPSGRQVEVDVIRHPPSVVIIPVPEPGCIILIRQFRYPINRLLWELPAGSVDAGETIEAAARRECHEEIGQVPETLVRLGSMFPTPGYSDEEMFFFRASSFLCRRKLPNSTRMKISRSTRLRSLTFDKWCEAAKSLT